MERLHLKELHSLLCRIAVHRGEYTLRSGQRSDFLVDCSLVTRSDEGARLVGLVGVDQLLIQGWDPNTVGGMTMGADPIACAIQAHARRVRGGRPLDTFSVRPNPKKHGDHHLVEGCLRSGDAAVIIDDVITTAQSVFQAISTVQAWGGRVLGVFALVGRMDGNGVAALRAAEFATTTLFTAYSADRIEITDDSPLAQQAS